MHRVELYGYRWLPDGKEFLVFLPNKGATDIVAVTLGGDRKLLVSWPGEYYFYDMPRMDVFW